MPIIMFTVKNEKKLNNKKKQYKKINYFVYISSTQIAKIK